MTSTATPAPSAYRQKKYNTMLQKILDTARAIMREQGVAALSMQELARRMQMRAPSLYHYFASKMDVYDALFRLGFQLFSEWMEQQVPETERWQEYVQNSFTAYLAFAKHNPELYQLCFERPVPGFVPSEASMRLSWQILEGSYQRAAAFQQTMHSGLTARETTDLLIAMMHGITALHMANEPELPAGQGRFGPLIPAVLDLLEKSWS